jgi:hypothetical protein
MRQSLKSPQLMQEQLKSPQQEVQQQTHNISSTNAMQLELKTRQEAQSFCIPPRRWLTMQPQDVFCFYLFQMGQQSRRPIQVFCSFLSKRISNYDGNSRKSFAASGTRWPSNYDGDSRQLHASIDCCVHSKGPFCSKHFLRQLSFSWFLREHNERIQQVKPPS